MTNEQITEDTLLEQARRIKDIKIEILDLQSKKKKIDQDINILKEEKLELESKISSFMFSNKKTSLDLKVLTAHLRNTSVTITDDLVAYIKNNMVSEIKIEDEVIQELIENGAIKIDVTITPNKDMLKTLHPIMKIPGLKVELKKYIDIK